MAQEIKQPDIWASLGSGIGKGLSEQVPKEIERGRQKVEFKKLAEAKGLSPFEMFGKFATIPGISEKPQLLQTGGDLLRQQAYIDAVRNQYGDGGPNGGKGYTPTEGDLKQSLKGEIPTLATPEGTAQSYKEFIPPTKQEEYQNAAENFNKNPARYNNNFELAKQEQAEITQRNLERQKAFQGSENTATGKEGTVKSALEKESKKLGLYDDKGELQNIHPKTYQNHEEKVLNAVLSRKEGGEGLTQEQAIKKYSKDLLQAKREYMDLGALSTWSPQDFSRRVDALRPQFASRNDLPQMMDQIIADYKVSPSYAAHKTYPIKKGQIPTLDKLEFGSKGHGISGLSVPKMNAITYEKLKNEMGNTKSPLSIAYELEQKGHDPRGWLNYLNNHRDNLEVWQADQLSKNINVIDLKDMWLRAWE